MTAAAESVLEPLAALRCMPHNPCAKWGMDAECTVAAGSAAAGPWHRPLAQLQSLPQLLLAHNTTLNAFQDGKKTAIIQTRTNTGTPAAGIKVPRLQPLSGGTVHQNVSSTIIKNRGKIWNSLMRCELLQRHPGQTRPTWATNTRSRVAKAVQYQSRAVPQSQVFLKLMKYRWIKLAA